MAVKDLEIEPYIYSDKYIRITGKGSVWGGTEGAWERHLNISDAFNCCGIRELAGFYVFLEAPELQKPEWVLRLAEVLNHRATYFRGGNVSFILNTDQRKGCKEMLASMALIGPVQCMSFRNHNMRNQNHLFIWTFGRKPALPKEKEIVVDVPVETKTKGEA